MANQTTDAAVAGFGIGVVQPQSGLDYPFVAPGVGAYPTAIADVENLFADFYLSYDDPGYYAGQAITNPLRIHWLYGFGADSAWSKGAAPTPAVQIPPPTHAADLLVVDANDVVLFDSTTADYFDSRPWGEYYTIYEWRKTTRPNEIVCRAVKYEKVHDTIAIPGRPVEYCPRNAILDERTIEKIPKRVRAMRVQMGDCVTPWFKEKVSFVNGYNTTWETDGTQIGADLRRTTALTFAAQAGSGKGQYGLCAAEVCPEDNPTNVCPPNQDPVIAICSPADGQEIKSINGVTPDASGNISLSANDCMWVRKPAAYTNDTPHDYVNIGGVQKRSVLAVGADCAPCCACDDYLEAAKYMVRLGDYYKMIGTRVGEIKAIHEENVNRWNQQRECRYKKPLELLLVAQPCPCIDVALIYCNHCDTCAEDVVLTVQFSVTPDSGSGVIDTKYTRMVSDGRSNEITISGGWPIFSVNFPTVNAGSSVYAQFRLCFCPKYPYALRGKLTGVKRDGPILAGCDASASVAETEATQIIDCPVI